MEESISMWSIMLPILATVVITGITAYCIYQQNKHYLKIKLAYAVVETGYNAMCEIEKQIKLIRISIRQGQVEPTLFLRSQKFKVLVIEESLQHLNFHNCLRIVAAEMERAHCPDYVHNKICINFFNDLAELQKLIYPDDIPINRPEDQMQKLRNPEYFTILKIEERARLAELKYSKIMQYISLLHVYIIREKLPLLRINKIKGYKNKLLLFYCRYKKQVFRLADKIKKNER
jgi:hypothetical protein